MTNRTPDVLSVYANRTPRNPDVLSVYANSTT